MSVVRVEGLDHVVLRVGDVEHSLAWYRDELGLAELRVDAWRSGCVLFPSLRVNEHTIIDLLEGERSGENVDHFCLVIAPTDLEALRDSGRFDVVGGPAVLFGARGSGQGLYVRDPDGNVVELRHYGAR